MLITNAIIRNANSFHTSLSAIEAANGTDKAATSARTYEDIFAMLNHCVDVGTFNKNIKREVGRMNRDSDTTTLDTALDNVELCNSVRAANNAVATLASRCNQSMRSSGSLATYKTARNHYQNQRLRNITVARHVYNMIFNEAGGACRVVRNTTYSAIVVDDFAIISDGSRTYVVFNDTPDKRIRRELKNLGLTSSTTSTIMYVDTTESFNTIASRVIATVRYAISRMVSTSTKLRRLTAGGAAVA